MLCLLLRFVVVAFVFFQPIVESTLGGILTHTECDLIHLILFLCSSITISDDSMENECVGFENEWTSKWVKHRPRSIIELTMRQFYEYIWKMLRKHSWFHQFFPMKYQNRTKRDSGETFGFFSFFLVIIINIDTLFIKFTVYEIGNTKCRSSNHFRCQCHVYSHYTQNKFDWRT